MLVCNLVAYRRLSLAPLELVVKARPSVTVMIVDRRDKTMAKH